MTRQLSKLHLQLLIGIALGIAMGFFFPRQAVTLQPLANGFIKLIKMLLAPIVFGTVTVGMARMGNLRSMGRVGIKALVYFEIVSTLALIIGLVVVNVVKPGAGMNIDPASLDRSQIAAYTQSAQKLTVVDFVLNIIPTSAAGAFVEGNILQVLLISVLFGVAISQLGERRKPAVELLDIFLNALFVIVRMVMRLAPLAAFGSIAFTVGKLGISKLAPFAWLMGCVYLTCALFIVMVLGPIAHLAGISLTRFLRFIEDEILVTFGTCSTEAVLPQMLEKLTRLGCEESLVGLVLPAGYMFNADGTSIYLTMAALFVAQATNTPLSLAEQILILAVLLLTSKGSAGVAGAGFVTLAATLASLNKIPIAGLVLLLGVESLLNQARAVTNLIGNGVATVAIARWEGLLDRAKAQTVLADEAQS